MAYEFFSLFLRSIAFITTSETKICTCVVLTSEISYHTPKKVNSVAESKYLLSFSSGGLYYEESIKIVELFLHLRDWAITRTQVIEQNLLQTRTISTAKRRCREICFRLELLTDCELDILINGSRQEQNHILWLAACKRYALVREFAVEVLREKFFRMDLVLSYEDYDAFFNAKAEWHSELEKLTQKTRDKLRQVIFRMMREAELISKADMINPGLLTPRVIEAIGEDDRSYLAIYPVFDADIERWIK